MSVGEVSRGDVLAGEGLAATYRVDVELDCSVPDRVQVHHGTRESAARVAWLGGRFHQLRLERPLMAVFGDRMVIRQIAPPDTLGGGRVLDAAPRRRGPSRAALERLEALAAGDAPPPSTPAPPAPAPIRRAPLSASAIALEARLREAGLEPPLESELDPDDLRALREAGRAVRVSRTLHYHADVLDSVHDRIVDLAGRGGGAITLAGLRTELGTSRKFAQALLEHFDSERLLIRRGDEHVLRRRA
jgi:selenocysteine-specific elongation factor